MNASFLDAPVKDDKRRELLYRGQLLVYSLPRVHSSSGISRARWRKKSSPLDPETAQFHLPVERSQRSLPS